MLSLILIMNLLMCKAINLEKMNFYTIPPFHNENVFYNENGEFCSSYVFSETINEKKMVISFLFENGKEIQRIVEIFNSQDCFLLSSIYEQGKIIFLKKIEYEKRTKKEERLVEYRKIEDKWEKTENEEVEIVDQISNFDLPEIIVSEDELRNLKQKEMALNVPYRVFDDQSRLVKQVRLKYNYCKEICEILYGEFSFFVVNYSDEQKLTEDLKKNRTQSPCNKNLKEALQLHLLTSIKESWRDILPFDASCEFFMVIEDIGEKKFFAQMLTLNIFDNESGKQFLEIRFWKNELKRTFFYGEDEVQIERDFKFYKDQELDKLEVRTKETGFEKGEKVEKNGKQIYDKTNQNNWVLVEENNM